MAPKLKNAAIILTGGIGHRYASASTNETPKQFEQVQGRPVFIHAIDRLSSTGLFNQFVVVAPKEYLEKTRSEVEKHFPELLITLLVGGARRQDSSRVALEWLSEIDPGLDRVVIHDGCRPYLSKPFLERMKTALESRDIGAWIPGVPVTETLKKVQAGQVIETVSRESLVRVQTPQIFEFSVISRLARNAFQNEPEKVFTDDASICEFYDIAVGIYEGDERNLKLTYPHELEILRPFLEGKPSCEPDSDTTFTG